MILIAISVLALAAWAYLAAVRLPLLRPLERLAVSWLPQDWPDVVAIIPARNEAETIGAVISGVLGSDYRGRLSVVLVDDHSDDGTTERALEAARADAVANKQAASAGGRLFDIRQAPPLPAGWTGKLWAVNAGLEAVNDVAPAARYVLLIDADIALAPATLAGLVAHSEKNGLALASLMARLDTRGVWGALLIPAFVFFFQKLYPFKRVNDRSDNVAAAAGGCMLVRADALEAIGGVAAIRGNLIDDCALARAVKQTGRPIWLGLSDDEAVSLRDNRSLGSIWSMVSRTAFAQLRHSGALLAGTVMGMGLLYVAPPAIALGYAFHRDDVAGYAGWAAWLLMALTYRPTLALYGQTFVMAFLLPLAAAFYTAMTVSSAFRHWRGRGGAWKGRTYPA